MLTLRFDKGTLLMEGSHKIPYSSWDPRSKAFRGMALYYRDILAYLDTSGVEYVDYVMDPPPCPELRCSVELRDYQAEALEAWERAGKWGVIVLPTGSGKTVIAMAAISLLNAPTLVVVPTLDLLEQWRDRLAEEFGVEIGVYGGGEYALKALTVATYDSAYLHASELGNRFPFLVFDEVHHLPAPSYAQIAEMFASPYRMGLTATYEREDEAHARLPLLVGGKVYELKVKDLAGRYLSDYEITRIFVDLTPEELEDYNTLYGRFRNYLQSRNVVLKSPEDFRRFIMATCRDREAREALLARNQALSIALNSSSKLEALRRVFSKNAKERILVFTQHNSLVHRISRDFLIPAITYKTTKEERSEILDRFRTGEYRAVVTSKVLDEGIDVPEATLAVILSGTGSGREFVQRLGRVLRKRKGKRAKLIEIVSKETTEAGMSWRRRRRHDREAR